jgi:hypothetical protein
MGPGEIINFELARIRKPGNPPPPLTEEGLPCGVNFTTPQGKGGGDNEWDIKAFHFHSPSPRPSPARGEGVSGWTRN